MQMNQLKVLFLVLLLSFASCAGPQKKRGVSSLESDLANYSGSYKLIKGDNKMCPEGEFSAAEDNFVVGASFRVGHINKGPQKGRKEGDCQDSTRAEFDGKKLTYTLNEACTDGSLIQTNYEFEFYTQATTKYIKMKLTKVSKEKGGNRQATDYHCLFAENLDN